ncbi:hypothetical protein N656DRAFT_704077 [Canariomyces notabilis]|uniref:MOZ protein represents a chromatin-associated acetyltransferase n=1 Tax=Canariomyces notabilis TaxID=2074819 RepID=A0AAN6TIU9_9PEZI|nr:hypothetical protein N656DRAFT_704077 [Canariomyces arenarius]
MATSRLTFLYPHLFRTGGRWGEPAASHCSHVVAGKSRCKPSGLIPSSPVCAQHASPFTTPSAGRQAAFAKRAGKAVEPLPIYESTEPPPKAGPDSARKNGRNKKEKDAVQSAAQATLTQQPPSYDTPSQFNTSPPPPPDPPATIELPPPQDIDPITQTKKGSPMDEILHRAPPPGMSSSAPFTQPSSSDAAASTGPDQSVTTSPNNSLAVTRPDNKPPHLTPAPYVHHFDSYTLVKQLQAGGYTLPQAILAMKAIRTLLASNLDVAQAGLVSKADVENETYLFRAACSELSAEVRNNRRVADEQLRQQRTLLQHEVDILAQRLNQELLTLNDSVRGMFNDRRMAVREEQKAVESRIQQINYKISVTLNSDAKSDIEGLRWVLIRRSVLGIIFMAVMTLGTLRYATYVSHQRQKEAQERAREEQEAAKHDGRRDNSAPAEAAELLAAN